jgi:hypothetical protein
MQDVESKIGIMGAKFRNRLRKYDNASDIVSGLLNFSIIQRLHESQVFFNAHFNSLQRSKIKGCLCSPDFD